MTESNEILIGEGSESGAGNENREVSSQAAASSAFNPANPPTGDSGVIMYRAAGFWIRLGAFVIDLLVIAGLNAIIWGLLLPVGSIPGFINKLLHVNALFLGVTGVIYFILMTYYFQQTLGKMIVGIKVIQRNGEPLSWITVIFRELVARSLSQIMGLNLGYIVCWFNAEKRCVHDLLSDTWVVYEKNQFESGYITISIQ